MAMSPGSTPGFATGAAVPAGGMHPSAVQAGAVQAVVPDDIPNGARARLQQAETQAL